MPQVLLLFEILEFSPCILIFRNLVFIFQNSDIKVNIANFFKYMAIKWVFFNNFISKHHTKKLKKKIIALIWKVEGLNYWK